jgi:hypothetical protein
MAALVGATEELVVENGFVPLFPLLPLLPFPPFIGSIGDPEGTAGSRVA